MNAEKIEIVYFLGIGGIGMSALARYFNHHKKIVMGYDRTPTALTSELEMEGISIHYDDSVLEIPQIIKVTPKEKILVVYTPAIPVDSREKNWFLENGFEIKKRSEVLGLITEHSRTIAIAGTHGKTTTSSLTAHLIVHSGLRCNAFLGGITSNYKTNLLLGENRDWTVIEADEFDRSFLTLHPELAVITSTDADHLDIYGSASHVVEGFQLFAERVIQNGTVLLKKGVEVQPNALHASVKVYTYSIDQNADFRAINIRIEDGFYIFDLITPEQTFGSIKLGLPGRHNVENAVAAAAMALMSGIEPDTLAAGMASFKGVQRRFETIIRTDKTVYIDDYAHHPTELNAAIKSAKELYPDKKITGIFQPHLFTRTRDFMSGFAESLSLLDEIILLPIYPARELPIEGITSDALLALIPNSNKIILEKDAVLSYLKENPKEVLLTLGAGDIDTLVSPIKQILL